MVLGEGVTTTLTSYGKSMMGTWRADHAGSNHLLYPFVNAFKKICCFYILNQPQYISI